MNKKILDQIIECLAIIASNPNVYSKELKDAIEQLSNISKEGTNED